MTNYEKNRAEEIMENISCFTGIRDEVLKLLCLFSCCKTTKNEHGQDCISKEYAIEKTRRILDTIPISLDSNAARLFIVYKIAMEQNDDESN